MIQGVAYTATSRTVHKHGIDLKILPQGETETPVMATRIEKRKTPMPPEPQDGGAA